MHDQHSWNFSDVHGFWSLTVRYLGRNPFNQNSNRSDREKRTTSKGGPVFSKLFRLDRTDPLSFGPKFPEILVEWIAPLITREKGQSLLYSNRMIGFSAFFITRVPLSSSCWTRQSGPPKWRSTDWLCTSRKTNWKFEWIFVCTQQSRLLLVGRDTILLIDYINCQTAFTRTANYNQNL